MSVELNHLLSALNAAEWRDVPYGWALVKGFALPEFADRLAVSVPNDGFTGSERLNGDPGHHKPYRLESRLLAAQDDARLSGEWQRFLGAVRSPAYRAAMSAAAGIDLAGLDLELCLWRYPPGGWLGPHTDKPDKVLTHVFNFNPGWLFEWGGNLKILGSEDEDDVFAELPPVLNHSVILKRSETSWHMVTPTNSSDDPRTIRRVVTAIFRTPAL